jgi:hypothetical protein
MEARRLLARGIALAGYTLHVLADRLAERITPEPPPAHPPTVGYSPEALEMIREGFRGDDPPPAPPEEKPLRGSLAARRAG